MGATGLLRVAAITAAVTAVSAPVVRRAMLRHNLLDVPNHRSSHSTPVARGGGLACLAGVTAGWLAAGRRPGLRDMVPVMALAGVGFADDRNGGISARSRLIAQTAAGLTTSLGRPWTHVPFAAGAMPVVVNTVNFMDGINGISGSTAVVWGAQAMVLGARHDVTDLGLLGALTAGAGLGFLPWNVPTARLFLGDVGSYQFGALMSTGLIVAARDRRLLLAAAAPLVLYLADVAQALMRRAVRGAPLTEAHREHTYQRLVHERGMSHVRASAGHATSAAICAVAWHLLPPRAALLACATMTTGYLMSPHLLPASQQRRTHQ